MLSPANLAHLISHVSDTELKIIKEMVEQGRGNEILPFDFMGWVHCIAYTAYDWAFSGLLNNVFSEPDGDFSQCEAITHTGALLIGTFDNFTRGDPVGFLTNINNHMPTAKQNELIIIPETGHTYQQKEQEVANRIYAQLRAWGN